jgi:hypothetical protein
MRNCSRNYRRCETRISVSSEQGVSKYKKRSSCRFLRKAEKNFSGSEGSGDGSWPPNGADRMPGNDTDVALGSSLQHEGLGAVAAEPIMFQAAFAGTVVALGDVSVRNIEDEDTALAEIV